MERVFENPLFFALGCATWIPLLGIFMVIFRNMVMGDLDFAIGIVAAGFCIAMGYLAMFPPHPNVSPIIFFVVLSSLIILPVANAMMIRRMDREIDLEALEDAYRVLGSRPLDGGAKFRVAEAVARLGDFTLAAILGESALATIPKGIFLEERQILASWKRLSEGKPAVPGFCGICSTRNAPNQFFCINCGAQLVLNQYRKKWSSSKSQAKILATWLAAVFAIVGIPLLTPMLDPRFALVATFSIAAIAIGIAAWIWWPKKVAA